MQFMSNGVKMRRSIEILVSKDRGGKMTSENYKPKTVREQLFYVLGRLYNLEQPNADGYVNIEINSLMSDLEFALELADNEKTPLITYRDVEFPKGTSVTSTNYPPKSVNYCSDSFQNIKRVISKDRL